MKSRFALTATLLFLLAACGYQAYPPSALDGLPMIPSSWHSGHVCFVPNSDVFRLRDGTIIRLFFTGGTQPHMPLDYAGCGMLYASVPSFDSYDDDNTYLFQKFVPDGAASSREVRR